MKIHGRFIPLLFLTACSSTGLVNPLPPVDSPETSSNIILNNVFSHKSRFRNLVFTLDNKPVYNFGNTGNFSFHLNEGSYLFGYTYGSETCDTEVAIQAKAHYVFNIGPECLIELESE